MTDDDMDLASLYREMSRIRHFELKVRELVRSNEIAGVTHEYIGQEAVAVGVCWALREGDYLTSTHRGHGHSIAKGASLCGMFAELLGRSTGLNRGRGGSMHVASIADGVLGANGIVGGGVPFALGAAWTSRQRQLDRVAVAFFGDGGANQGVVFECMNMAAAWSLPVLFVCENNHYAVTLKADEAIAGDLLIRAAGFGLAAERVDGMDVVAVVEATEALIARVRSGQPAFIEFDTYRFVGHHTAEESMGLSYRSTEEIDAWQTRDPLAKLAASLGAERTGELEAAVGAEIDYALEQAQAAARPDVASALDYMYATPLGREDSL